MVRTFRYSLWVGLSVWLAGCQSLPAGVSPVQATWRYGQYSIPGRYTRDGADRTYRPSPGGPDWTRQAGAAIKPDTEIPVVLYIHGCAGIGHQATVYRKLLMAQGYAVFMPNSFARPGRRKCHNDGPLYRRVELRKEEIAYAYDRLRRLSWVDHKRVILMGFSEGGNAVDNWSKPGFRAEIITGSACTLVGGKPAAPPDVPVLAIVGAQDRYRPGKSCHITRTVGGSRSIVIPGANHEVAGYPQTREAIEDFLRRCCAE